MTDKELAEEIERLAVSCCDNPNLRDILDWIKEFADKVENRSANILLSELKSHGINIENWDGDEGLWPCMAKHIAALRRGPERTPSGEPTIIEDLPGEAVERARLAGDYSAVPGLIDPPKPSKKPLKERLQLAAYACKVAHMLGPQAAIVDALSLIRRMEGTHGREIT